MIFTFLEFTDRGNPTILVLIYSSVLCKCHRKKPILESLFHKAAGLKDQFLRTPILKSTCERLLVIGKITMNPKDNGFIMAMELYYSGNGIL